MVTTPNPRLGILLMIAANAVFSVQDGISRHLGETANVYMVVMLRFWFFGAFAIALAMRSPGGLARVARSRQPLLQLTRGLLLIGEICVMVAAFVKLGLIQAHAVFVCYPLLVVALSGPILGEKVGWRRWTAVLVGFAGVLIILNPGGGVLNIWALVPFASALMFAVYGLLTRLAARKDSAETSFFWTGVVGAVGMTPLGLIYWQPMSQTDWMLMGLLCLTAVFSHGLLIKAYEVAEASDIQPFAYFQLPFISILGLTLFGETLHANVAIGAVIVVAAGLFTLWRQRLRERQARQAG